MTGQDTEDFSPPSALQHIELRQDAGDAVAAPSDVAPDPGSGEVVVAPDGPSEPLDWAWVEEWRAGREPVPWAPGLALAVFTGLVIASAVYVLSYALADRPVIAVLINVLVAAGISPAVWLARGLPVLRWIAGGAVLGVLGAWLAVFIFLA